MKTEKRRKFIINVVYILILLALVYVLFKYAINFLMPFLIAYVVSVILRPIVLFFEKKLKLKNKIASILAVVLFYSTIGVLICALGASLVSYLASQISKIPAFYNNTIKPLLSMAIDGAVEFPEGFDPTLAATIESLANNLFGYIGSLISTLSGAILSLVTSIASSLPTTIIGVVFSVIASYYFTADYDKVGQFVKRQFTEGAYEKAVAVKTAIYDILFGYLKSYALILGITFAELTVATLVLGVDNFFAVAFMIAIFDILPVVGTGTILIPWAVIELIRGNYGMAIGLIIVYVIVFIIRQIIEPKIVGDRVGLHPLVTLVSMFVGTVLFGVIGLFGIPITMAIIVDLHEKGVMDFVK